MKTWTLFFALALVVTAISFAGDGGDGKDGKNVQAGHACYWSEPSTFDANLTVPEDQEDGGKETQMRYVCENADNAIIDSRNFISDSQPDTWVADGRDKGYSLTRW